MRRRRSSYRSRGRRSQIAGRYRSRRGRSVRKYRHLSRGGIRM